MTKADLLKSPEYAHAWKAAQFKLSNRVALYRLGSWPKELVEFIGKDDRQQFSLLEIYLAVAWLDMWSERGQPGRPAK